MDSDPGPSSGGAEEKRSKDAATTHIQERMDGDPGPSSGGGATAASVKITKAYLTGLLDAHDIPYRKAIDLQSAKRLCSDNGLIPVQPLTEKERLTNLLVLGEVKFDKKANVGVLRSLCEEHGFIDPPAATTETRLMVVKCGLYNAIGDSMTEEQYDVFSGFVESYVNVTSRMLRRASLVLAFHMTRLVVEGAVLPDLYNQGDTYWRDWLRIGLDGCYPRDATDGVVGNPARSRASYEMMPPEDVYADDDMHERAAPKYFDQVLTFAARGLETIVCNNAWVPLFVRLRRVAQLQCAAWKEKKLVDDDFGKFKLMTAVRSEHPDTDGWPTCARKWVDDVRTRLAAEPGVYMFDDHGNTKLGFAATFRFNFWMQQQFVAFGARRGRLMPVMGVGRKHVRLDARVLTDVLSSMFPEHPTVIEFEKLKAEFSRDLYAHLYPDAVCKPELPDVPKVLKRDVGAEAFAAYKLDVARRDAIRKSAAYKAHLEAYKKRPPPVCCDPDKAMLPKAPPRKKLADCSAAEWTAQEAKLRQHNAQVQEIKSSPAYLDLRTKYDVYDAAQTAIAQAFFPSAPIKKGWKFSGSVATDGIAVSIQYEKEVIVTGGGGKTRPKKTRQHEHVPVTDYDKNLVTVLDDMVVLGLDPGRSNLATVSLVHLVAGKLVRKTWSLSRGAYREKSGINREDMEQRRRFDDMAPAFQTLGAEGSTLNAIHHDEVLEYARRYSLIADAWWALALKRRQSRAQFRRYMGKRSVLDAFFGRIRRTVSRMFPGKAIEVAYGEPGLTMSPTGKGEVAVPTCGTYKACKRVFYAPSQEHLDTIASRPFCSTPPTCKVTPVDEAFTTAVSWATGARKERVYRTFTADGKPVMGHTAEKQAPVVPEAHRSFVEAWNAADRARNKNRRGGWTDPNNVPFHRPTTTIKKAQVLRYPIIRGVSFIPETLMFVGRDPDSATAIARLRVMEILQQGRPLPFCRAAVAEN